MTTSTKALTVVAIDDNPNDLLLLRRKLERLGQWTVNFRGLNSIEGAHEALDDADVVFLDYRMRAVDGVEGIQRLRTAGVQLPLVMLTGQGDERVAAQSRRKGADDYLCKDDLSETALAESLCYVLEQYRRQRKHSRALRNALVDGLTGLLVKEYFSQRADEEFGRARRYNTNLACLLLDLDHFKKVNDTWGHFAGDEVLKESARIIRGALRATDTAGRFGGEEFAVILPECDMEGALAIAERIRSSIAAMEIHYQGAELRVSVSIGAALVRSDMTSVTEALQSADKALYRAKTEGRNRVCAAGQ